MHRGIWSCSLEEWNGRQRKWKWAKEKAREKYALSHLWRERGGKT